MVQTFYLTWFCIRSLNVRQKTHRRAFIVYNRKDFVRGGECLQIMQKLVSDLHRGFGGLGYGGNYHTKNRFIPSINKPLGYLTLTSLGVFGESRSYLRFCSSLSIILLLRKISWLLTRWVHDLTFSPYGSDKEALIFYAWLDAHLVSYLINLWNTRKMKINKANSKQLGQDLTIMIANV